MAGAFEGLFEDLADQGTTNAMGFGDFSQRLSGEPVMNHGVAIDLQWATTDVPPFELGTSHAGTDTLDNKVTFEFSDGRDDDDDGSA